VALPGTKPTADRSQVRRTNKPTEGTEWTEVVNLEHNGPPLGDRPTAGVLAGERPLGVSGDVWPAATLDWWDDVRTMPHAALWTRADWRIARTAAEAHARFVEGWKGCASGSELRQREKQLGMTADARRDLRIKYVPAPTSDAGKLPDNVRKLDDFRDL
jgi:hypothetical protein